MSDNALTFAYNLCYDVNRGEEYAKIGNAAGEHSISSKQGGKQDAIVHQIDPEAKNGITSGIMMMFIVRSQSSASVSVVNPPARMMALLRKAPMAPGTTVMALMAE